MFATGAVAATATPTPTVSATPVPAPQTVRPAVPSREGPATPTSIPMTSATPGETRPTPPPAPAAAATQASAATPAGPAVRPAVPLASPSPGLTAATASPAAGRDAPGSLAALAGPASGTPGPAGSASAASGAAADPVDTDETDASADAALDWHAFVPTDVADHLATMDRAARESGCGVPWHLLAAIARVESNFGRNMATSSAGAMGYGQFLPSSWAAFGGEGNVYDYRDALPAIATYLCQSGLERDPRSALFAYNHADWYVDLVLDLAVRYDRMAPGSPTPDVLDVGPAVDVAKPLRYADGRNLKRQTDARRSADGATVWLGVPWRGRAAGAPISGQGLETTTLAMVRAGLGLAGDPAAADSRAPTSLEMGSLADRAWRSGLLPLPPSSTMANGVAHWSLDGVRSALANGHPVVALVAAALLPGHAGVDTRGDQPIVLQGVTAHGFIYNDPSFSSSLGYGMEIDDDALGEAWSAAATPFAGAALAHRPMLTQPRVHAVEPSFPALVARVVPTSTPVPAPPETSAASTPAQADEDAVVIVDDPATQDREVVRSDAPPARAARLGWSVDSQTGWGAIGLVMLIGSIVSLIVVRRLRVPVSATRFPDRAAE